MFLFIVHILTVTFETGEPQLILIQYKYTAITLLKGYFDLEYSLLHLKI